MSIPAPFQSSSWARYRRSRRRPLPTVAVSVCGESSRQSPSPSAESRADSGRLRLRRFEPTVAVSVYGDSSRQWPSPSAECGRRARLCAPSGAEPSRQSSSAPRRPSDVSVTTARRQPGRRASAAECRPETFEPSSDARRCQLSLFWCYTWAEMCVKCETFCEMSIS